MEERKRNKEAKLAAFETAKKWKAKAEEAKKAAEKAAEEAENEFK
jgi:hypothetical protein